MPPTPDRLLTDRLLRLPRVLAARYARGRDEDTIDELECVGNLALVEAARRYDPNNEAKASLETFAYSHVRHAIRRAIGVGGRYTQEGRWRRLSIDSDVASEATDYRQHDPGYFVDIADFLAVARRKVGRRLWDAFCKKILADTVMRANPDAAEAAERLLAWVGKSGFHATLKPITSPRGWWFLVLDETREVKGPKRSSHAIKRSYGPLPDRWRMLQVGEAARLVRNKGYEFVEEANASHP